MTCSSHIMLVCTWKKCVVIQAPPPTYVSQHREKIAHWLLPPTASISNARCLLQCLLLPLAVEAFWQRQREGAFWCCVLRHLLKCAEKGSWRCHRGGSIKWKVSTHEVKVVLISRTAHNISLGILFIEKN